MRATFSRLLAQAAQDDERLLLLTGDHGYALFDEFRQVCPDRFINCGVAEQNMVGVAAGLTKAGLRPIVYGLAAFIPMRVLEQIKMDVCYESLPVIFIGDGAGVVYSTLGASHQCSEDVAALRAIPNLDIYSPADRFELGYTFQHMRASNRPSYLRFGKADCGDIHQSIPDLPLGDPIQVRTGSADYGFIATGAMVSKAVQLSDEMGGVPVWSVPCLAPMNARRLQDLCRPLQRVFTLEEHSVHGGLGSLVAEILSVSAVSRLTRLGITGKFSELCGSYNYLLSYHGLGLAELRRTITDVLISDR